MKNFMKMSGQFFNFSEFFFHKYSSIHFLIGQNFFFTTKIRLKVDENNGIGDSLRTNTKIPNFEQSQHWMSEHRTFWTSHFGPKLNFKHVEHHKKLKSSRNIKLYVPRLVWSHNNRTELQTLPNITFWPKTIRNGIFHPWGWLC